MKDSQKNMLEHSKVKVRFLKLYLQRYLNIMNASKIFSKVHIYDLFCSSGIYENGEKGSAICILETISDIQSEKYCEFRCVFNDKKESKILQLNTYIQEHGLNKIENCIIETNSFDYKNIIQEVTEEIRNLPRNEKAFIFIDPYGYKHIRFRDIQELLENKNSEILLFLPTQFMFRFESEGTPKSLIDFIEELVPDKLWPKSKTGLDFIENLKDIFKNKLGDEYFTESFIISRKANQYFSLFFFTSHILGLEKIIDVMWQIDEIEGRGWCSENQDSLFQSEESIAIIEGYERKLKEFCSIYRTNVELYEFTLLNRHLPKHTNQVLKKWKNSGKLLIEGICGFSPKKGAFYNTWDNFKTKIPKVKIKVVELTDSGIKKRVVVLKKSI